MNKTTKFYIICVKLKYLYIFHITEFFVSCLSLFIFKAAMENSHYVLVKFGFS
jgi:hypothetical protein